ncbi:MAG: DUF4097 family beta strand repeat protein [Acidobacteria bacterium]|nr:DUF4097 family beta strand repeat protein [Acidobacteriota bacterium]
MLRTKALLLSAVSVALLAQAPPVPPAPPAPPAPPDAPAFTPTRTERRVETLGFNGKLWVVNRNGSIKVEGWNQERVDLTAFIRDSDSRHINLKVERKDGGLAIEAVWPQSGWFNFGFFGSQSPRCEFVLKVPSRIISTYSTTNGGITVKGIEGYAGCDTTNGDIRVSGVKGEIHADTTNGGIIAEDCFARIKGGTTNGDLDLANVAGGIDLDTTNGSITAKGLDGWGEGIRLESTNGEIEVELGQAKGDLHAENTNGRLDIKLTGVEIVNMEKHEAQIRIPGRAQKINLETTNGSITVR